MKVLVCDPLSTSGIESLKAIEGIEVSVQTGLEKSQLLSVVGEFDIIIVRSATRIDRDVLQAAKKVRLIARAGMGVDTIDVDAATEKGIIVMNTPAANAVSAAEHSMALILAMMRNLPFAHQDLKQGTWNRKKYTGSELAHKTLGLLGLGNVGRNVARYAKAFQMKVIAFDPFVQKESIEALGIEKVELEELYKRSDILSIHAVLNEHTRGMVGTAQLAHMKTGVRICNCARAEILNRHAMIEGLESGVIGGLALDVFESEPPAQDDPLIAHPKVVVTPHLGASTVEAQDQVMVTLVDQLKRYIEDDFILNGINVPAISHEKLQSIGPFLQLAFDMGSTLGQLVDASPRSIQIKVQSPSLEDKDLQPIANSGLAGFLKRQVSGRVNIVNAPMLAQERDVEWGVAFQSRPDASYTQLIEIHAKYAEGEQHSIRGMIAHRNQRRIVGFDGFEMEVQTKGSMLWLSNEDLPGIVGQWGSILGKENINISQVQVSSLENEAKALAVINIDSPAGPQVLQALRSIDKVYEVKQVHL